MSVQVHFGIGINRETKTLIFLSVNRDKYACKFAAEDRGKEAGCECWAVCTMGTASRFENDVRCLLAEADIVGHQATRLYLKACESLSEILSKQNK